MLNKKNSILNDEFLLQGIMDGDLIRMNEYDFYHDDEDILINYEENREAMEDHSHYEHYELFEEERRKVNKLYFGIILNLHRKESI